VTLLVRPVHADSRTADARSLPRKRSSSNFSLMWPIARVIWLLEELGVHYELEDGRFRGDAAKRPELPEVTTRLG